jgi:hypothetical protein
MTLGVKFEKRDLFQTMGWDTTESMTQALLFEEVLKHANAEA